MSSLHKADFCVNHAMSVNVAHNIAGRDGFCRDTAGPSTTWTTFLSFLEPPGPQERYVSSFYASTIEGHSTTISSVVINRKRYVWYFNPWGYRSDTKQGGYDQINASAKYLESAEVAEIEDLSNNICFEEMDEVDKIKVMGFRLKHMMTNLEKADCKSAKRAKDVLQRWETSRFPRGDKSRGRLMPQWHVMSILQLLAFATDSNHIIVIHPFESMEERGVQRSDGVNRSTHRVLGSHGACVLWSTAYIKKVKRVVTQLFENRRSVLVTEAFMRDTIKSLRLDGAENPQAFLATYMDQHGGQTHWKAILSAVYDTMPYSSRHRRIRKARLRAGENLLFGSTWHVEAIWKLDLVTAYVEKILCDKFGSQYEVEKHDEPEWVAGFIEAMYIVSTAEARARSDFVTRTAQLASYVVKSELHNMYDLKSFINMLKMLLSCKQLKHRASDVVDRQLYPLPTQTRADKASEKKYLQDHAAIYGYGATDDDGAFTEDTRKKRKSTRNVASGARKRVAL